MLDFFQQLFAPLLKVVNVTTLAIVAFIESIFFPLPPDALLMPLVLERPHQVWVLAGVTTISSVSGAVVGYMIGLKGGRPILNKFVSGNTIERVEYLYQKYDVSSVFIAGFTPIPYKVFAVAAGVFNLSITRFVCASLIGRFCRFGLIALLVSLYGQQMIAFVETYFEQVTIVVVLIAIVAFWIWKTVAGNRAGHD